MSKIKPEDHPDFIGGWKWTKLELDWINERIGTLEAALFQAQEAAKDLEARLTKTEGWLNEAMWNYGELKREQLANSEETSSSPVQDWEAVAADQALTIALLKSETATQPAPVQEPVAHCEAGPEHCQQCHLEDRSLALAAAVRYVKNNTPKLVSDEICMALASITAAQRPVTEPHKWVGLTNKDIYECEPKTDWYDSVEFALAIEAKLREKNGGVV